MAQDASTQSSSATGAVTNMEGLAFTTTAALGPDVLAGEDALSEVSIDVNPTDRTNQVIVGHDGELSTMNTFFTTDEGQTWTAVTLGNGDDGFTSTFRFDPAVAFDANGSVYVAYGVGFTDSGTDKTAVVVCRSTDGGANYQCTTVATTNDIGGLAGNDKWFLDAGPAPSDPTQQNLYIAWTQNVTEGSSTDQRIVVSSSTDGGVTFSSPVIINDPSISGTSGGNLFADPAVASDGTLYVSWMNIGSGTVFSDVSTDGGATWGTDNTVTSSNTGFKAPIPAQPDRGIGIGPVLDIDRSGGPNDGRLYLTYTDVGSGGFTWAPSNTSGSADIDVLLRTSDDGGSTWSAPAVVHDDGGTKSQFLPWVDVDQVTGQVTLVWYDARNDPNNQQVEVFLGVSDDGGSTFESNTLVSDAPSDQSRANSQRYLGNFLEYIGVGSQNGVAFPVWADNSQSFGDLDYFTDQIPIGDPPVADAGSNQTVECLSTSGTEVTLDASGSTDPNGDALTYTWREGGVVIAGPTTDATVQVTLDRDTHTVKLTVDDSNLLTDTDEVVVIVEDTTPPIIALTGGTVTLECGIDTYSEPGASASDTCDPSPMLTDDADTVIKPGTPGTYTVTYTATDAAGNSTTETREVIVEDTIAPEITVGADPITLWPPNHKYETILLDDLMLGITDACDQAISPGDVALTEVTSDEAEDARGGGDGFTNDDMVIDINGPQACRAANLRAERLGRGNGRVYELTLKVADASGNVGATGAAGSAPPFAVHVPQDIEISPLGVDDGNQFTVAAPTCEPAPSTTTAATSLQSDSEASDAEASEEAAPTGRLDTYELGANYPNPFGPVTEIGFALPEPQRVRIVVYDMLGRVVAELVNRSLPPGRHTARFDGRSLPSGSYFYRMQAGPYVETRRMTLVR